MPFGKLYTYENNPRSTAIRAVAKANDLELDIVDVDTTNPSPEYLKLNKLGKVPTFEGADGYVLYEAVAIAIYNVFANFAQSQYAATPPELLPPRPLNKIADSLKQSQNEKTTLLGKTKQDYASILKWTSYFNTEVLPSLGKWYRPLIGRDPYNKKAVDDASKTAAKVVATVEEHLKHNTYLVGERITLADLFAVGAIARGFEFFFDKNWRQENPNVSRWYETVYNQPIYSAVAPKFELLDTPKLTNVAPKKAEQPKKEAKKEAAPKKEAAKPAEEDAPAPKPKHPLEALPRATFALDEWKRYYSNHDEADSMKWFWENAKFDEFSLWKVKYKYNDELTLVFMSNNLVGGFNTRLEASRKYLFGCASVYGENNDSVIEGAFVVRGDEYLPVFDVAPDYESYEFEKLDPNNPEHRAYVEAQWTWDKPVVHNGKEYKHADGKVFK